MWCVVVCPGRARDGSDMARSRKKLGEILVGAGKITSEQLEEGLAHAKSERKKIGEALIEKGWLTEETLAKALAKQSGLGYVDISKPEYAEKVDLSLIGEDLVRKHKVLPISKSGNKLKLIIHDPKDLEMMDMLRFRLNADLDPIVSTKGKIGGRRSRTSCVPRRPTATRSPRRAA